MHGRLWRVPVIALGCALCALSAFSGAPIKTPFASGGLADDAAAPIPAAEIPQYPGRFGSGDVLLFNDRLLTPAGTQTVVDPVPTNAILSPNGQDLLVTDDGRQKDQELQVISTSTLRVQQVIPYARPAGLFFGLTYADHGRRVYASGGNENVIHAFTVSPSGRLTKEQGIGLQGTGDFSPSPAGITMTAEGRLIAVAEDSSDRVSLVDPTSGRVVGRVWVGDDPYTVVDGPTSNVVYASVWGASRVAVIHVPESCATSGSCAPSVTRMISVGAHPSAMTTGHGYLYVADSNSDEISVISMSTNRVVGTIGVGIRPHQLGSSPEGLALSPDGSTLYVANSGDNAVAVVHLTDGTSGSIVGRIPTAEYPSSVTLDPSQQRLFVTDMQGYGPGPNWPKHYSSDGLLSTIPIPSSSTLQAMSAQVAEDDNPSRFLPPHPAGNPVPLPGHRSPIKHVIYIVKENQSYDQVFGDLPDADGDPSLTRWGARITPNLHALALRFGIFDNFYDDGYSSADGHNWAFSADDDDFNQKLWWQRYSHRAQFGLDPGADPMDLSPGGYIWDRADQAGITYRDYGEFYQRPNRDLWFMPVANNSHCPGPVATTYLGIAIPPGDVLCLPSSPAQPSSYALFGHHDWKYRALDMRYSDIDRIEEWEREFRGFVRHDDLPQLEVMWLPNDHTAGGEGFLQPASYLAQNDRAVGMLVDAVSHSKYWKSTAIFITQDDAQGSFDHINARRTECLVISPYTQTNTPEVHSGIFDNSSMLRTMGLILGLKPMSDFDATAAPMREAFHNKPDMTPFDALPLAVPPRMNS